MIGRIPEKLLNPYRNINNYFDDLEDDLQRIDPSIEQALSNKQAMLPDNEIFEEAKLDSSDSPKYVAVKKQMNLMGVGGLEYSLLREIKLL
jgi:hypothetical protein